MARPPASLHQVIDQHRIGVPDVQVLHQTRVSEERVRSFDNHWRQACTESPSENASLAFHTERFQAMTSAQSTASVSVYELRDWFAKTCLTLHRWQAVHFTNLLDPRDWIATDSVDKCDISASHCNIIYMQRLHPVHRRFQPPPSSFVVIFAASGPTYTAVHRRRSCVSGGWKPPLEQSAA